MTVSETAGREWGCVGEEIFTVEFLVGPKLMFPWEYQTVWRSILYRYENVVMLVRSSLPSMSQSPVHKKED